MEGVNVMVSLRICPPASCYHLKAFIVDSIEHANCLTLPHQKHSLVTMHTKSKNIAQTFDAIEMF